MRKKLESHDIDGFLKAYGRKAPRRGEPNDRKYSRQIEDVIKRMDPAELDALMRGEEGSAGVGEDDDGSTIGEASLSE
jgi:hypothetical protein